MSVRAVRPVREGGVRKRPGDGYPKGLNAPTSYFHGIYCAVAGGVASVVFRFYYLRGLYVGLTVESVEVIYGALDRRPLSFHLRKLPKN